MEQEKIRIIIADDHQLIRSTWKFILEQEKQFSIVAECTNGAEAIDAAGRFAADVILMDINMHPVNGFEATRKILRRNPSARIIGMSVNNQPSYARNILQLGARGYVTKDSTRDEMVKAILTVNRGGRFICDEVRKKMNEPGDEDLLKGKG